MFFQCRRSLSGIQLATSDLSLAVVDEILRDSSLSFGFTLAGTAIFARMGDVSLSPTMLISSFFILSHTSLSF